MPTNELYDSLRQMCTFSTPIFNSDFYRFTSSMQLCSVQTRMNQDLLKRHTLTSEWCNNGQEVVCNGIQQSTCSTSYESDNQG